MEYGDDRRASTSLADCSSPFSAAENIFPFWAFSMLCRQENFPFPLFASSRAVAVDGAPA
jgi:hypothetical protein